MTSTTTHPESSATNSVRTDERPARPRVAVVLAVGFLIVAAFQAALTFGAPLGAAAQGGMNPGRLPDALRVVTGVSTIVWLFAMLLVLARGGRAVVRLPQGLHRRGTWGLVGLLGLGTFMNLASSALWERFGWGPLMLLLFILTLVLARSALPTAPAPRAAVNSRTTFTVYGSAARPRAQDDLLRYGPREWPR